MTGGPAVGLPSGQTRLRDTGAVIDAHDGIGEQGQPWVPFGKADSWAGPWVNLKLGAQYVLYTEFNGAAKNYDGFGRNASDNNSIYLFAWLIF